MKVSIFLADMLVFCVLIDLRVHGVVGFELVLGTCFRWMSSGRFNLYPIVLNTVKSSMRTTTTSGRSPCTLGSTTSTLSIKPDLQASHVSWINARIRHC